MDDYISRDECIKDLREYERTAFSGLTVVGCISRIKRIPPADVRPVTKGHWLWDKGTRTCSNCGQMKATDKKDNFCSNCGADMRSVFKPGSKEAWQSLEKAQEDFRKAAQVIADMREVPNYE